MTMGYFRNAQDAYKLLLVVALLGCCLQHSNAFYGEWGPDLEGPWCATRTAGQDCCLGRDDKCSVPILGTMCYCDIFCNDTAYDCCPDYWPHCRGYSVPSTTPRPATLPPPRQVGPCVTEDLREYAVGESYTDNCNTCECVVRDEVYGLPEWSCTNHVCLIRPELIKMVNDGPFTWRASNYSALWGKTLDDGIRYRLGTFLLDRKAQAMTPLDIEEEEAGLQESFDSREEWAGMLYPIQDQGDCGSSWAHSSIAITSDRLSIETTGLIKDKLSVQHLLSCDKDGQKGCEGGHVDRAWWYLRNHGVVTEDCYRYTSGLTNDPGICRIWDNQTEGFCPTGIEYNKDRRYQATPAYRVKANELEIMNEIKMNGPVQAIIEVKEDFFMYKEGVYSYAGLPRRRGESSKYSKSGFHSVRIMGWGVDYPPSGRRIKYWICANSWGTNWGEGGYFRILRGVGESRIENHVIGVWVKIVGDPKLQQTFLTGRKTRLERVLGSNVGRYRSLPTGRRLRRLQKKANLRMKSKNRNGRRRNYGGKNNKNKKSGKTNGKKLSWKERQERRRARRERRRLRLEKKLRRRAKLSKSRNILSKM